MSGSRSIAAALAVAATLALSLLAVSPAFARSPGLFHLRVGPGVTATVAIGSMRASCGDDANCQFDVPANSSFDVVARGPNGNSLRWSGCASQPEANRCRVEMGRDPVLITVR